ncbi:hypothetical protein FOL47_000404 [Perkinsus chesapeaki]|uniref:Uncharacterized protein n=1 Tax=Perkinsus chesapeaki TaxID=330153 RepID=A0A7J6KVU0_PERCH|nr:hypothetical protein FOL47_000404 [Perkinsus chesapeaki]
MISLCIFVLLLSLPCVYCGNETIEILHTGKGGLCDPTVNQASGRYKVNPGKEYFFWTFESRNDPSNDPVFLVLSAGPAGASTTFTVSQNGPCTVNSDGTSVERNPYSWTTKANVVWLDHPVGVGFSTGSSVEKTEREVVNNICNFIKLLFGYTRYKGGFYLVGMSGGGHLLPQVAAIVRQSTIALEGLIFVNAMIDALSQYPSYPEMAFKSPTTSPVISQDQYDQMVAAMPDCLEKIKACNVKNTLCETAYFFCGGMVNLPVVNNGYNLYDLPQTCPHPRDQLPQGCDNQELPPNVQEYMNSTMVKLFFGVRGDYVEMSKEVDQSIPSLLESGVRVMVMAGDRDYVCNYLGLKQWMLGLEWSKKEAFKAALDVPVKDNTGRVIGLRRSIERGLYTFVQVYNAGHGVPREKPAESLRFVNDFISRNLVAI